MGIAFGISAGDLLNASIVATRENTTQGILDFYTAATGPALTHALRITQNQDIAIGTTTPYSKLTVTADGTGTGARLFELVDQASTTVFSVSDQCTTTIAGNLVVSSTIASSTFANGIVLTCLLYTSPSPRD